MPSFSILDVDSKSEGGGILPRGNRGSTAITRRVSCSVRRSFQSVSARLQIASSLLRARRSDSELSLNIGAKSREAETRQLTWSSGGFCDQYSLVNRLTRLKRVLNKITLFGHVVPQHGKQKLQTAEREGSGWLYVGADPHLQLSSWSEISFRWEPTDEYIFS